MPIEPLGKVSLTKFVSVQELVDELAALVPGVDTAATARSHPKLNPLWNDLLIFEPKLQKDTEQAGAQVIQDDELLRAARDGRADARLLVWCALLIADQRLETIARTILTTPAGKFDSLALNRDALNAALEQDGIAGEEPGKVTTNILRNMADSELFVPTTYGGTIVGVDHYLPTSHAVPGLVTLLAERADYWGAMFQPAGDEGGVDFALALGANHWLNLTRDEFERAARPLEEPAAVPARGEVPAAVAELADLLARKGQVVLQGPPGTGKTYLSKRYVDWATVDRREESRLQAILDSLPTHERTPARVADEIDRRGLTAVWDIVQFHPSYEYNDFVRTLVAEPIAGGVTFVPKHRVFSLIVAIGNELDRRGSAAELVLVLDELNRGNIPSIFGELLYALEYRGEPVATPYAIDGNTSITVPTRLKVIGTMNTADRSIAVIDYALRRRFVFLDVASSDAPLLASTAFKGEPDRAASLHLYRSVRELLAGAAEGMQVGPSYFMPDPNAKDETAAVRHLASAFVYEVLPLLSEYALEGEVEEPAFEAFKAELGLEGDTQTARVDALVTRLLAAPGPTNGQTAETNSEG